MKKQIKANFKKALSMLCSVSVVLGVCIPTLSFVANAEQTVNPYGTLQYPKPDTTSQTYTFDNSSDYEVANGSNALYTSSYRGTGWDNTGRSAAGVNDISVSNGKLVLKNDTYDTQSVSNRRAVKTWVINKNGAPFETTPGKVYKITADVQKTVASGLGRTTFIGLANGVVFNDTIWANSKDDNTIPVIGASSSAMRTEGGYQPISNTDIWNNSKDAWANRAFEVTRGDAGNYNHLRDNCWFGNGDGDCISDTNVHHVTKYITAYDMGENGANYLTMYFCMAGPLEFTIDNITIQEVDALPGTPIAIGKDGDIQSITLDFEDANNYSTGTEDNLNYWSYMYGGAGRGTVNGTTNQPLPIENQISISNGSMQIGSGIAYDNPTDYGKTGTETLVQSWLINKNGRPIEFNPGERYVISFKVKQNHQGVAGQNTWLAVTNGIVDDGKNGNWWFAPGFGAWASVMPDKDSGVYTYAGFNGVNGGANKDQSAITDANTSLGLLNKVKTEDFGNDWVTVTKSFTAYDFAGTSTEASRNPHNYLALNIQMTKGQELEIDDIKIEVDKFTTESTVISAEETSKISLDFENDEEYQVNNTRSKYQSFYYYIPGRVDGSNDSQKVAHYTEAMNALSVSGGKLKLTSHVPEIFGYNDSQITSGVKNTTLQSWVINKNGSPIEIVPRKTYTIKMSYKETTPPMVNGVETRDRSFISVANGVAYDDVNAIWSWSKFGTSASIMAKAPEGVTYAYKTGDRISDTNAQYPNNAIKYWTVEDKYNHIVYSNSYAYLDESDGNAQPWLKFPEGERTITKTFTAYDITENGTKNRKNYLALAFLLDYGQEIEIDNIEVTVHGEVSFDVFGDDSVVEPISAKVGDTISLPEPPAEEDGNFVAWYLDSEYTKPVTNNYTVKGDVTLYAFYSYGGNTTADDDGYSIDNESVLLGSSENTSIDTNKLDDSSIKVSGGDAYFPISEGSSALTFMTPEKKTNFEVEFDYYAEGITNDIAVNFFTADVTGLNGNKLVGVTDYVISADKNGSRNSGRVVIRVAPNTYYSAEDLTTLVANTLFVSVNGLTGNGAVYFDNITVNVFNEGVIDINYGRSENDIVHVSFNMGQPLNSGDVITPEKAGFNFGGFYDASNEEAFDVSTSIPYDEQVIYADWVSKATIGDVNGDGNADILDLVRLKKVSVDLSSDSVATARAQFNGDATLAENLVTLKKILLDVEVTVEPSMRIAGIPVSSFKLDSNFASTNALINEAAAKLSATLGNTGDCNIIIEIGETEGISVRGNDVVISSSSDANLLAYVVKIEKLISRYKNASFSVSIDPGKAYADEYDLASNFAVTFADEFVALEDWWVNRDASDHSNKGYYTVNGTDKIETNSVMRGTDAAVVSNGTLKLNTGANLNNAGTGVESFYTTSLTTKGQMDYKYGYLEVKAKLAAHPAYSTIWGQGSGVSWYPEMDLVETLGTGEDNDQYFASNVHTWSHPGNGTRHTSLDDYKSGQSGEAKEYRDNTLTSEYHTYGMKWDSEKIVYYFDGEAYLTVEYAKNGNYFQNARVMDANGNFLTTGTWPFERDITENVTSAFAKPINLVLNAGMGAGNYGPLYMIGELTETQMEVDYVRLYQRAADGGNLANEKN